MKNKFSNLTLIILASTAIATITACRYNDAEYAKKTNTDYVNPLIGTAYVGHTFPGPSAPFGGVQAGPDTIEKGGHWDYCAGYKYEDDTIYSFSQTHMNGTGCPDLGDIAFMPFCKNAVGAPQKYEKQNQISKVGYYSVILADGTSVEIAADEHSAIYRIKYGGDDGGIFLDLRKGMARNKGRVLESEFAQYLDNAICGKQKVRGFIPARNIAFAMEFSKPILSCNDIEETDKLPLKLKKVLRFNLKKGDELIVKIGISSTSSDGAKANLKAEIPDWDFDRVRSKTVAKWNKIFDKIDIDADDSAKENFYTSMYHLCLQPNNIADIDGAYLGTKSNQKKISTNKKYYTSWSLWDTYRAANAWYTILDPERCGEFAISLLEHYDDFGVLPINVYYGKETYCMIGNHGISVLGEYIAKDIEGFDRNAALEAMKISSQTNMPKSNWTVYEKYGYFPFDIVKTESVSRTLEACYNDHCVAVAAKKLGDRQAYEKFSTRSHFYKNLFDHETKFMRGKDSSGNWRTPFNPFDFSHDGTLGGDYTEGSAWQYTWHVQQNVPWLIEQLGGNAEFSNRLDELFKSHDSRGENAKKSLDITGLIGQYVQGNEPSHHIVYMYTLADNRRRCAELMREIFDKFYMPRPDGLCGNDDCGQMSAWYMFGALGFYPLDPSSGEYVFGAPQIRSATIALPNGKKFEMRAHNLSKENKYVAKTLLNGKDISSAKVITHKQIMDGAILEFFMTDK